MYKKLILLMLSAVFLFSGCSNKNAEILSLKEIGEIESHGRFMGVSPDEQNIVEITKDTLNVVDAKTGKNSISIELDKIDQMQLSLNNRHSVWSPNGKYILFTDAYDRMPSRLIHHSKLDILALDLDKKALVRVVNVDDNILNKRDDDIIYCQRWTDDNNIVYAVSGKEGTAINHINFNNSQIRNILKIPKSEKKIITSILPIKEDYLLISLDVFNQVLEHEIILYNTKDSSTKTILSKGGNAVYLLNDISDNNRVLIVSSEINKQTYQVENKYSILNFTNDNMDFELNNCEFNDLRIEKALITRDGSNIIGLSFDAETKLAKYHCYDISKKQNKVLHEENIDEKSFKDKIIYATNITSDNKLYEVKGDKVKIYQLGK